MSEIVVRATVTEELTMCFNKKVVGTLAVVALATLVFAPQLVGRVVPLLLVAACPLSMLLMMRGMNRGGGQSCAMGSTQSGDSTKDATSEGELREEITRLRAELALREGTRQP